MEDGPCCRQSEHSKTNGPDRLAWLELHTENQGEGFIKELGGLNRQRRAQSETTGTRRIGVSGSHRNLFGPSRGSDCR